MSSFDPKIDIPLEHPLVPHFIPKGLTTERIEEENKRLGRHSSTTTHRRHEGDYNYQVRIERKETVTSDFCRFCKYQPLSGEYECALDRHSSLLYPPLPEYEATPAGWIKKVQ